MWNDAVGEGMQLLEIFAIGNNLNTIDFEHENHPEICHTVTVYDECNYEGDYFEVNEDHPVLDKRPGSICVPDGQKVVLYTNLNY